ncbi:MAG: hypothetical protein Salg2KO_06080 [Salibacteraceae bacterium]
MLSNGIRAQQECDCDSVFNFIYQKWDEVENMKYDSYKVERKMNKMESAGFEFMVQRDPFKVAGIMEGKGHRLLYDPQQNQTEALYISKGFPFTNVWLDIHGKVFRGLNHYTISNAGCEFIFGIIRNEYNKMPDNFVCTKLGKSGEDEIDIYAETNEYKTFEYTAKAGETTLSIADKFKVMAYALIEYNSVVDDFTEDLEGETIMVPTHYGSKVRLVVSARHGMPTRIRVDDPKGMLEEYKYTNYRFNQRLPANYFTEEYLDSLD